MSQFRFRPPPTAQRQLVWLVSGTAALQIALQAADAGLQGDVARTGLWACGAAAVALLVAAVEKAKARWTA